jgi:hypothetical protein
LKDLEQRLIAIFCIAQEKKEGKHKHIKEQQMRIKQMKEREKETKKEKRKE